MIISLKLQLIVNSCNLFTSNLNIPFVPNIVGLISVISLINRTEMWGYL